MNATISAIIALFGSALLALILTPLVRKIALRFNVLDRSELAPDRKRPRPPVPLLGGWAVYLAFALTTLGLFASGALNDDALSGRAIIGLLFGGAILVISGTFDDRKNLKAGQQFIWTVLAVIVAIAAGVGIRYLSNPFGNTLRLDQWEIPIFTYNDVDYTFVVLADIVTFIWIIGMIFTVKLLDGLDGLVSGVAAIGSLVVFGVTQLIEVHQPGTGLLALALAGSCLGFLPFNFAPARIFLGQGGSLVVGFLLGCLAVVSGGKIATALLIMGIPILDVVWVIIRRVFIEHRSPFTTADRKHLHFRLLDVGFSERRAVLLLYGLTAIFGGSTLFVRGTAKAIVLGVLVLVMFGLSWWLVIRSNARSTRASGSPVDDRSK